MRATVAIVGIGEVPTGRFPDRSALEAALTACREAIADAGNKKEDIDYVLPTGHLADSRFNTDLIFSRLVEELGLGGTAKGNLQVMAGGASSAAMLKTAQGLIRTGAAKVVLCVHTEKLGTAKTGQEVIDLFATLGIPSEWETPYGMNFSAVAGLITQGYMYETGTTAEEVASVCVSNRKWAMLNPNAMYRKPLTIEEVLNSKMLSAPCMPWSQTCLRTAQRPSSSRPLSGQRASPGRQCTSWARGSRVTQYCISQVRDLTRFGYAEAAREAFQAADLKPSDMDIAEIYDSYPVSALLRSRVPAFVSAEKPADSSRRGTRGPEVGCRSPGMAACCPRDTPALAEGWPYWSRRCGQRWARRESGRCRTRGSRWRRRRAAPTWMSTLACSGGS